MDWVFLFLGSIYFVEVFIRFNALGHIESLKSILNKITRVVRSQRISDHWKERVLLRYALALFKKSLLIFLVLIASFVIFPILGLISEQFHNRFIDLTTSLWGISACTCIALSYAALRSRASRNIKEYNVSSKVLHQIALGAPFVGEAFFDIEKSLHASRSPDVSNDRHVFVCGLARAGTTVLMRKLYESDQFCSLTYRDMPFVLAPNLWRKLSSASRRNTEIQERAHGDGLMVDYDSPEALEEVFWKTLCGSDYIRSDCLVPMSATDKELEDFKTYVSLILRKDVDKRYLSKNNNNILRLSSIVNAFPNAKILIPFRQPDQQAYSLMRQHKRFTLLHSEDRFVKKYMTWLVHHEFGADHRPFRFDGKKAQMGDYNKLDYWLETWVNAYTYIYDHMPDRAHLVCYETLCHDSDRVWNKLAEKLDVSRCKGALSFSRSFHKIDYSFSNDLLEHAKELYIHLRNRSQ